MHVYIKRTDSSNLDFQNLIVELDQYLAIKNGILNAIFTPHNTIDLIQHVVIAYANNTPVGCGAIKQYEDGVMEIKRMFVINKMRSKGIAGKILIELQAWAKEMGYTKCVLETGNQMTEAIGLYKKHQFVIIPNYGPYRTIESSVCFEKKL